MFSNPEWGTGKKKRWTENDLGNAMGTVLGNASMNTSENPWVYVWSSLENAQKGYCGEYFPECFKFTIGHLHLVTLKQKFVPLQKDVIIQDMYSPRCERLFNFQFHGKVT